MAQNIGIFVCGCRGQVSDVINPALMEKELAKLKKRVGLRVVHTWLCGDGGQELIKNGILQNGLDCVVLAACPHTVNGGVFGNLASRCGLSGEMFFRIDIREGCAYPHREKPDEAFRKAANLIRMWVARARLAKPFEPLTAAGNRETAVIGGGLAGLTAALDLAEAGISVTLIERDSCLGGNVARLNKIFPRMCDAGCGVTYLYNRILETGRVSIKTLTEVKTIEGSAGRYTATLATTPRYVREGACTGCGKCIEACPVEVADSYNFNLGKKKAIRNSYPLDQAGTPIVDRNHCPDGCRDCSLICPAGAVDLDQKAGESRIQFGSAVVATGWEPYPLEKIQRFGFGKLPDVISNMQMERMASEDGPTGGKILCPGSGREVRRVVFIQCAGSRDVWHQRWCSAVCCTASIKQAMYIKEKMPKCHVYVLYNDIRTPGEYEELYMGAQRAGVVFIRTSPAEIELESSGALKITAEDTLMRRIVEMHADLVVLAAGVTPSGGGVEVNAGRTDSEAACGLTGAGGFHTGHKQCFPLETANQGIYYAGCCQEPMDMANTVKSALAAAGRVIKTGGSTVSVSPFAVVVDRSGCDKCKRCLEECPYGVYYLDEQGFPVPDALYCRGCHVCIGSCPRQCVVSQGLDIKQQIAMVGAKIKETAPGEPLVVAFMCENDAYPAAIEAGGRGLSYPPNIHIIPVRCIGSVNMVLINDGISVGIDGFLLAGCQSGQCHYISGSDRAEERLNNIKDTFRDMMMDRERVKFLSLGIGGGRHFAEEADAFVERLRQLGPNPFKEALMV